MVSVIRLSLNPDRYTIPCHQLYILPPKHPLPLKKRSGRTTNSSTAADYQMCSWLLICYDRMLTARHIKNLFFQEMISTQSFTPSLHQSVTRPCPGAIMTDPGCSLTWAVIAGATRGPFALSPLQPGNGFSRLLYLRRVCGNSVARPPCKSEHGGNDKRAELIYWRPVAEKT